MEGIQGILNAIKFISKKKKEEEIPAPPQIKPVAIPSIPVPEPQVTIPTPTPTPIPVPKPQVPTPTPTPIPVPKPQVPTPTPVPTPIGQPRNILDAISEYFEPAPQVRVRDIVRELPGAAVDVGRKALDIGHTMLKGTSHNLVSIAKTFGGSYGPTQATTPVTKFFLGEEPIYTIGERAVSFAKDLKNRFKLPKIAALPLATGLVFADALSDVPGINIPLGGAKKLVKPIIESSDEFVSIVAKEFKKKAGESLRVPIVGFYKHLAKKFNVSDDLLNQLDKGPLVGENFSIERAGKHLEFIFDEGFKPIKNVVERLKRPMPVIEQGVKTAPKAAPSLPLGQSARQGVKISTGTNVFQGGRELTPKEVANLRHEEEALAKEMKTIDPLEERFGRYADDVRAMIGKIRRFGNSVDKKTNELYREHIPGTKKHLSSDEVATGLSMSENEFMEEIVRIAEGGQVFPKVRKPAEKVIKNISHTLTESEFNAIYRESSAFLREKYGLMTPKQFARRQAKLEKENLKFQQRMSREANEYFAKDLIDASGRGGIRVPFSDLHYKNWRDKDTLLLNRETPLRNIEEVAGKDAPKVREFFFDRVVKATTELENFVRGIKQGIENIVEGKLGIKADSVEDKLVMRYGEGRMTKKELMAAAPQKWRQIIKADRYFRALYDFLLTKINDIITRYGYDPVLRRDDYYTHSQELGNLLTQLGLITRSERLPAWVNGLTADFKPGKQFFRFAQPRVGGDFKESAIGAFETYLYPAARQIYYTDPIQRGRALWNTLAQAIQKNKDLPPTHLSDFMAWLNDHINILAGKKTLMGRGTEGLVGRKTYAVVDTLAKQASLNLIANNISAAMTNWIVLIQALATTDKKAFVKGLINALVSPLTEANNYTIDGVQSGFLRRRIPYRQLSQTLWDKAVNKSLWLFNSSDKFSVNTIIAGKYFEEIGKGVEPLKAMAAADEYAARLIGDRSFGQMPAIFYNQGVLAKLMTMFQFEPNNQLSFIFKDAPKYAGAEDDALKTAVVLAEIALYSHLFNNMFEWATGRRPTFDPIHVVLKSYDIWTNDNAPVNQKAAKTARVIANNLPFISNLTGGGRIPVSAGIPSTKDIAESPLKAALKFGLVYLPPGGGYQAYKTLEGMEAYIRGYTTTPKGRVKYPVEQDISNLVRSVLFGQYSTPEANRYFEGGETALGEKQSEIFKLLREQSPEKAIDFYNRVHLQRNIENKITELREYGKEMMPKLSNPATADEASEQFNERAGRTQAEIAELLQATPETRGIIDVFLGRFGELIKEILGSSGEITTYPSEQPVSAPAAPSFPGISEIASKGTGAYPGISQLVSRPEPGVKMKRDFTREYTPKAANIKYPVLKTGSLAGLNIKPVQMDNIRTLKIKLNGGARSRKPFGIKINKIKRPTLRKRARL